MTLFQLPASVQHARHHFKHALGQSFIACGHLHTCWCSVVFEMWRKNLMFVRKMRPNEKNRKLQEEKALEVSTGGSRMTYRCLLASGRPGCCSYLSLVEASSTAAGRDTDVAM
jgi:hypothetical protein